MHKALPVLHVGIGAVMQARMAIENRRIEATKLMKDVVGKRLIVAVEYISSALRGGIGVGDSDDRAEAVRGSFERRYADRATGQAPRIGWAKSVIGVKQGFTVEVVVEHLPLRQKGDLVG